MPKLVLLWTDVSIWLLAVALVVYALYVRSRPDLSTTWHKVFAASPALAAFVVLLLCLLLTLADSVHFRSVLPQVAGAPAGSVAYDARVKSLLDVVLSDLVESRESTYSRPLAYVGFTKESLEINGKLERVAPRLVHGGVHLNDPATQWRGDVLRRLFIGLLLGIVAAVVACLLLVTLLAWPMRQRWRATAVAVWRGETSIPWRVAMGTLGGVLVAGGAVVALMGHYHVFGTDVTGNDVLYQALKSIRTAFVIGTLATLATLPLAVVLGIMAGYFKGWVDELIQYLYTVLSSIPNILLIAACVLMVQVFIDKHPDSFETGVERADVKLFLLCAVLGLTGWAGLCRLLRAETLKLRELEFVQAASAFGVGHARIMWRHVFPQCGAPDADRHGARVFCADPLRSGAFLRGCWRGSVDEQLRRHDQSRPQRNEPRPLSSGGHSPPRLPSWSRWCWPRISSPTVCGMLLIRVRGPSGHECWVKSRSEEPCSKSMTSRWRWIPKPGWSRPSTAFA